MTEINKVYIVFAVFDDDEEMVEKTICVCADKQKAETICEKAESMLERIRDYSNRKDECEEKFRQLYPEPDATIAVGKISYNEMEELKKLARIREDWLSKLKKTISDFEKQNKPQFPNEELWLYEKVNFFSSPMWEGEFYYEEFDVLN